MDNLKKIYNFIPSFLKNSYLITFVLFFIWMMFFDTNTFLSQVKMKQQIQEMKGKRAYYVNQIESVNQARDELLTNDESLEKYARENYLMKREGEEIFVIVKEEDNETDM